jgi:hypothetical protein
MSRPTVTVVSAKGEATKDTVPVPNVFKVSSAAIRTSRYDANHNRRGTERSYDGCESDACLGRYLKEQGHKWLQSCSH